MTSSPTSQVSNESRRDNLSRKREEAITFQNKFDSISYSLFGRIFEEKVNVDTLEDRMREAGYGISPELYAARLTSYTLISAFCLTLIFLSFGSLAQMLLLDSVNFLVYLPDSIAITLSVLPGSQTILLGVTVYAAVGGLSAGVFRYWPRYLSNQRERSIERTLPYATTYMFALSRGGLTTIEIFESLADSEGTYGEIASEIETVVRDVKVFNIDIPHAMRRASRRTASEDFSDFADDFVSMQTTGADMTNFFENKMDQYLDRAETNQERFISFLEVVGEVYVTIFVAGPLFALVIIMVLAMIGGGSGTQVVGIVYGVLPILNILFYFFISTITPDRGSLSKTLARSSGPVDTEELAQLNESVESEQISEIISKKKKKERTRAITEPIEYLIENSIVSAVLSVPFAIAAVVLSANAGRIAFSVDTIISNPEPTTLYGILLPFWIVAAPIAVLEFIHNRRQSKVLSRIPDSLDRLASTNEIGLSLGEALDEVADNTTGRLGDELRKTSRDVMWRNNINDALYSFANRIRTPVVARTVRLITDANNSTSDIAEVLRVAARDVSTRQKLEEKRSNAMGAYLGVISISFLVYLFVIFQIDTSFLVTIADVAADQSSQQPSQAASGGGGGAGFDLGSIPIDLFRAAFYHSVIIQGIGSGILAGTLKNNSPVSGLKFAIVFTVISSLVLLI